MRDEAVELYRRVSGVNLDADSDLAEMLRLNADGKWVSRRYGPSWLSQDVLDARVLAGLFLLDETIIWSARHRPQLHTAFRRYRALIDGVPHLRQRVRRFLAHNGGQRIDMVNGHSLLFVARPHGARGFSADCAIVTDYAPALEGIEVMLPTLAASKNPQVLITA